MNHRFSASFKNYAGLTRNWPEKRSFEYYAILAHRNQMLRGRRLSDVVSALLQAFEVSKYNPRESSTSKKVTCNNDLCAQPNHCLGTFGSCP
ncbi:hypothetical protein NC653_013549 [Populus alba x Populus x berolinensis]|uniref:Uncharacterized protein n=1 Tax=Populus alba x Populus x berolinensis TaxID=444605 RepID=A0AAD6QUQ8_9ROSI|nr:hypothetical protein NC653_013549 [Populus alba x Populus x berolinensis]